MIDRGKMGKTLSEVKPVENIKTSQNSQENTMLESLFRLMSATLLKKENPTQKSSYESGKIFMSTFFT